MADQPNQIVRFNDVTAAYHEQRVEIDAAMARVLERGDFIGGRAIAEFESGFAMYTGSAACVGVSSGTSALHVAMLAAGIGPGDEVITTPMTFIATAEAISLCGAKPVFADIDPETLNLSPASVEGALTPHTRAILFVYLHGNPGGAKDVQAISQKHNLLFFEDCAQAHGARFDDGHHVGSLGYAAAYSFFPAKNLGAFGDAGAVTTMNDAVAHRTRQLVNHGRSEKYLHEFEGLNARMDTLQAAVLEAKLGRLDRQVDQRNRLARQYVEGLKDLPLKFQQAPLDCRHAWHLFTLRLPERDQLQSHLKSVNIETGIHYPVPLHLQPAYSYLSLKAGDFPVAENTARETLSLPMYPQLGSAAVSRVVDEIQAFFSQRGFNT